MLASSVPNGSSKERNLKSIDEFIQVRLASVSLSTRNTYFSNYPIRRTSLRLLDLRSTFHTKIRHGQTCETPSRVSCTTRHDSCVKLSQFSTTTHSDKNPKYEVTQNWMNWLIKLLSRCSNLVFSLCKKLQL